MGDAGQIRDVGDAQSGVRDDLGVDEPRGGADRRTASRSVMSTKSTSIPSLAGSKLSKSPHTRMYTTFETIAGSPASSRVKNAACRAAIPVPNTAAAAPWSRGGQLVLEPALVGAVLGRIYEPLVVGVVDVRGVLGEQVAVRHDDGSADRAGDRLLEIQSGKRPAPYVAVISLTTMR